jgi:hypothetical protein
MRSGMTYVIGRQGKVGAPTRLRPVAHLPRRSRSVSRIDLGGNGPVTCGNRQLTAPGIDRPVHPEPRCPRTGSISRRVPRTRRCPWTAAADDLVSRSADDVLGLLAGKSCREVPGRSPWWMATPTLADVPKPVGLREPSHGTSEPSDPLRRARPLRPPSAKRPRGARTPSLSRRRPRTPSSSTCR